MSNNLKTKKKKQKQKQKQKQNAEPQDTNNANFRIPLRFAINNAYMQAIPRISMAQIY